MQRLGSEIKCLLLKELNESQAGLIESTSKRSWEIENVQVIKDLKRTLKFLAGFSSASSMISHF